MVIINVVSSNQTKCKLKIDLHVRLGQPEKILTGQPSSMWIRKYFNQRNFSSRIFGLFRESLSSKFRNVGLSMFESKLLSVILYH